MNGITRYSDHCYVRIKLPKIQQVTLHKNHTLVSDETPARISETTPEWNFEESIEMFLDKLLEKYLQKLKEKSRIGCCRNSKRIF